MTLLDADTNEQRFRLETDLKTVRSIALSPSGTMIATGYSTVTLWNTSTGKQIGKPLSHGREFQEQEVLSVTFSPDSKQLATVTLGGTLRLWDTTSQKIVAKLRDEGNHNSGKIERSVRVIFSPDGKKLALLYGDIVELWDWALAKRLHQFNTASQEHYPVRTMAFSPTGEVLAIGSSGTVVILDAQTLVERTRFKAGTLALAFSPNGRILVTGGAKGMLKLWDWSSNRELIRLTGHTSEIQFIAFSPDGKKLATSDDEALRVWHAPTEATIAVETKPTVTSSSWRESSDPLSRILNAGRLTP